MEIDATENSDWLFDCGLLDDISAAPGGSFAPPPPSGTTGFSWSIQALNNCSDACVEIDFSNVASEGLKEAGSRKRLRTEMCGVSSIKASREKIRRDKLNERFLELGSVLEPGRPPKTDKAAILNDAVRMVTQLRSEAQRLRESNENMQEKVKELKAEKNELRDDKQKMKADKQKLEQQLKALSAQPNFLPHPSGNVPGNKLMPFISYPSLPMWQFIPPGVRDTSQDHVLRPPVA